MEGETHVKKEDSLSKPYATARCRFEGTVKTKNWCALAIALIREEGPVTHPICTESTLSVQCMLCIRLILHKTHIAQQQGTYEVRCITCKTCTSDMLQDALHAIMMHLCQVFVSVYHAVKAERISACLHKHLSLMASLA